MAKGVGGPYPPSAGVERVRERALADEPARPLPLDLGARAEGDHTPAVSALAAGTVIGVTEVMLAISFAALVFSGPLAAHLPGGIGMALMGAAVMLAFTAWRSTLRGTLGSVQDTPAVVLSLMAAAIAARVPPDTPEGFLTVVLALVVTGVLTGVLFVGLGTLGLGGLVRFVPHPVVAGFLAGTGWLLLDGGFGVLTSLRLMPGSVNELLSAGTLAKWLPALLFAIALVAGSRRWSHPLLLPGALLGAAVLFYVVVLAGGWRLAEVEAGGWLVGPLPQGGLWRAWSIEALGSADWGAVFSQTGSIATVLLLATIGLLLNVSGIELALQGDADLNRELRTAGAANVLVGATGGIVGYQALSLTVLADKMGGRRRLTGLAAAAIVALSIVAGSAAIALLPRIVLGALLMFVGVGLLVEWAYDTWFRLPRGEYFVVIVILGVMAFSGFLEGIALGIAVAVLLFVVSYSRTDVVKHELTGATYRSSVERSPVEHDAVVAHGAALLILELQGFLFFGTATGLLERLRGRLDDQSLPPLRCLIIDFRRVSGLDSSAAMSLARIQRLTQAQGATVVFSGLADQTRERLERSGMSIDPSAAVFAVDLDHAVQWFEEQVLAWSGAAPPDVSEEHIELLGGDDGLDEERLMPYLERLEVPAGAVIIKQGEESSGIFFLSAGRLTAQLERSDGDAVRLREVGVGAIVGELSHYLGGPRTATIVAEVPSVVYRLGIDRLNDMEEREPELATALHRLFARLLARRLSETLRSVEALLD